MASVEESGELVKEQVLIVTELGVFCLEGKPSETGQTCWLKSLLGGGQIQLNSTTFASQWT